jgi:hypothetical protein
MNRVILGILCGIVFGMIDAGMVAFGKHPDHLVEGHPQASLCFNHSSGRLL